MDGVVAENGALAHFPDSGLTTPLAPPIPPAFLARLRERGISFQAGQCLVDADADSPQILDVIRELELPLVLLFNRSRVMALNQVIAGAGPAAVGDFIRRIAATGRMPTPARARRRLIIGHTDERPRGSCWPFVAAMY